MKSNKLLISILIFGGLALAGLSFYIGKRSDLKTRSEQPAAKIELQAGQVILVKEKGTQKQKLTGTQPLFFSEIVETGNDGSAQLYLDNGFKIRVSEDSSVFLEAESSVKVLHIARGEVQVSNFGPDSELLIAKNGQRFTAKDYELSGKSLSEDTSESAEPATAPTSSSKGELSPEIIQASITSQRSAFFRCYSNLLQKTPGVAGLVGIRMTIERSGKPSSVEITSTSLRDTQFKNCLIEVGKRTEFKPFKGDPITTSFPLKFE